MEALDKGCENLDKQIENVLLHGVPCIVALNHFPTDTDKEVEFVLERAKKAGASAAVVSKVWAEGGPGGIDLAKAIIDVTEKEPADFRFLYPSDASIKEKIETIATKIYGADGVDYLPLANRQIRRYTRLGFGNLPICMAKTHLSLSHDPNLKGRPRNFRVTVREVRASMGAGFLYPLLGEMRTMPGLPSKPAGAGMDIDEYGKVTGLF
jgi:formyltetrahydrofolate synthetase